MKKTGHSLVMVSSALLRKRRWQILCGILLCFALPLMQLFGNELAMKDSPKTSYATHESTKAFAASQIPPSPLGVFKAFFALRGTISDHAQFSRELVSEGGNEFTRTLGDNPKTYRFLSFIAKHKVFRDITLYVSQGIFGDLGFHIISPSLFVGGREENAHFIVFAPQKSPVTAENFTPKFFGVASADFQMEGIDNRPDSDWAHFAQAYPTEDPFLLRGVDFLKYHRDYIDELASRGIQWFRFSMDWSYLEPKPGEYNRDAIRQYHNLLSYMKQKGVQPAVTLLHFTKPQWFAEKGSFEKSANIADFVQYCEFCAKEFPEVDTWYTINEPTVDMFNGYVMHDFPPRRGLVDAGYFSAAFMGLGALMFVGLGISLSVFGFSRAVLGWGIPILFALTLLVQSYWSCQRASTVLLHSLQAHCRAYEVIKEVAQARHQSVTVGITHAAMEFESRNWYNLPMQPVCWLLSRFLHKAAIDFYATGTYDFFRIRYQHPQKPPLDVFGLQKYGNVVLAMPEGESAHPGQIKTCMGYPIYPETLAQSCLEWHYLRPEVPLHITECGAPSDGIRAEYIASYLQSLRWASQFMPIERFFYWAASTNIEWTQDIVRKGYSRAGGDAETVQFGLLKPERGNDNRIVSWDDDEGHPHCNLHETPGAYVLFDLTRPVNPQK